MLALKRALSFSLSFALAYSPTLAFAADDQPKPEFQAESRKDYRRDETAPLKSPSRQAKARSAQRAMNRKTAAKPVAKPSLRKPASTAASPKKFNSIDAAVNSMYRPVMYKGQEITISQVPGVGGRAKAQVIHGPDFEEILVDEFNTGTASTWKLSRGNVDITATHPFHGTFSQIEVREKRAKSYVHAFLQMNPDEKTFRVANYVVEPFHVDHDSTEIACVNDVTDPVSKKGVESLRALLDQITETGLTPEAALVCKANHYQEALFDKSCYEGKFAADHSAADMAAGLAKIFSSVGSHDAKGHPRYLQCLNEMGFASNAAKMQLSFILEKANAKEMIDTESHRSDRAKVDDAASCSELSTLKIYDSYGKVRDTKPLLSVERENGAKRLFTCDATQSKDGEFFLDSKTRAPQISLRDNSEEMKKARGNSQSGYAELLFHEMLHQSGIPESGGGEDLVGKLELCCASPDSDSPIAQRKCNDLNRFVSLQVKRQVAESSLGMYLPGYAHMKQDAIDALGETNADAFMADWYAGLESDPSASKAWARLETCAKKPKANLDACTKASEKDLTAYSDKFMAEQTRSNGATDYSDLKSKFAGDLKLQVGKGAMPRIPVAGVTVPTVIPATAAVVDHDSDSVRMGSELIAKTLDANARETKVVASMAPISDSPASPKPASKTAKPKASNVAIAASPAKTAAKQTSAKQVASRPTSAHANVATGPSSEPTEVSEIVVTAKRTPKPPTADGASADASAAADDRSTTGSTDSSETSESTPQSASDNETAASDQAAGTQSQAQAVTSVSAPSTVSKSASLSTASVASTKPMPALSTAGAVPLSSSQGQSMDGGTANSIQTAQSISSSLASAGAGIINSFTSSPLVQASAGFASQVAQARMPASVSSPPTTFSKSSNPHSSSVPSQENSGGGAATKAKSKTSDGDEPVSAKDDESGDKDPAKAGVDSDGRPMDPKSANAVASLASLKSAKPQDVLIRLKAIDPATFVHELGLGDRSEIVRALQANGWTVIQKNARQVLMNPKGQCFAPDPTKTIVPRANCE